MKFTHFQITDWVPIAKVLYKATEQDVPLHFRPQLTSIFQTCEEWEAAKKPFYRLYPGYIETVERLDFNKFPWKAELPLPQIALELPESLHFTMLSDGDEFRVEAILVNQEPDGISGIIYGAGADGVYANVLLPDVLEKIDGQICFLGRVALGLQLVKDEPDLFRPVLLRRDAGKPIRPELVARAIRNGVYGFDVGEAIPTSEEIEELKRTGALQGGEKSPHFRTAYFGLRWTGPNRKTPKIVKIKECLVGFKKISTIPTGFYGRKDP